eukprot:CAMPEP_0175854714 /NCGR_PEP_ID=MMETSP0107_2-20121207/27516_1 /TAXON_ID=195067 ORGANISM="Goniomonas pacifica, Strain CCMP1869" /NCGR_SAMPLE_ID=MMETSP0107_2 /ASSEMBLY_ACC=CAM_ASM_000203 /LENGTH=90 /DNA_ID=CAMNT_0017170579 /DNA_START=140 /DNA_END=412 /DNA_ORIENTATION=-
MSSLSLSAVALALRSSSSCWTSASMALDIAASSNLPTCSRGGERPARMVAVVASATRCASSRLASSMRVRFICSIAPGEMTGADGAVGGV